MNAHSGLRSCINTHVAVSCAAILLGFFLAPIWFLAGVIGGLPNQLTAPLVEQWALLKILWASNPEAATRILMEQPLMVITHNEPSGGIAVWRLFFYPVPVVVYVTVSIFAAFILFSSARGMTWWPMVSLLPGMAVLVFVTTYVQVSTCCTGGPRWALDIWLYSLAYDPLSRFIDWQQFYLRVEGALPIIQAGLVLLGAVLLAAGTRRVGMKTQTRTGFVAHPISGGPAHDRHGHD